MRSRLGKTNMVTFFAYKKMDGKIAKRNGGTNALAILNRPLIVPFTGTFCILVHGCPLEILLSIMITTNPVIPELIGWQYEEAAYWMACSNFDWILG